MDDLRVAFEIECGLLEFVIDFVHRFECVVLEDFLADLLPKIFLLVELGRVGRQKLQPVVAGITRSPMQWLGALSTNSRM